MNNTAYLQTWFGHYSALPITQAELLALGIPQSAIDSGEHRGEMETRGPWALPVAYRALCMSTIYGENRSPCLSEIISETVHGPRTMTQCTQSGHCLEGRVTLAGKSYSAFTSSQLFDVRLSDGTRKLVNVATVQARISDTVERAEIQARVSAGLIPVTRIKRTEPNIPAEQWCRLLGFPVSSPTV